MWRCSRAERAECCVENRTAALPDAGNSFCNRSEGIGDEARRIEPDAMEAVGQGVLDLSLRDW